ncbi:MAG: PIN domain-containing protein [Bradyrhizobium sp.]|uniref:PIN domain-containing protein n=1 Tax=Bradyrhizobium sp. TaxID=376 RepID=UPI002716F465|nr:PIN domain-containing protein [Bradyrhizobium sp.]MDO8398738.1 PIN domain-containing protein [Bradyrhizobium sp.]
MTPFFDTNVLVYAFLDVARRTRAVDLIASGGVISAQVLNEFTNVARRKRERDWADIERAVSVIRARFPEIMPLTADTHAAALGLARDHGLTFYDALIVASAIEAECDILYSEDMQHGRSIGGLTIVNPFIETAP